MADQTTFHCSVVTPQARIIDDEVRYASLPAWDGQMGFTPRMAPVVVRLGIGPMRLDFAEGGTHYYLVRGGFAQMLGDELTVLCDHAQPGENIVEADALREFDEALSRKAVTDDEVKDKHDTLQAAREARRLARVVGHRGV
jgi:F-type H+-transporting ATPase subunit epsilon